MKNKKIAIFDLDGTIDKGDTFLAFMIRIFFKSPKRWFKLPNLIFGYFTYIINPNFVRTDLKLLFLKTILKNQNEKFIDSEAKSFAKERLESFSNKNILKTILEYNKEGTLLIIASGSLDVYVKYFAELLKINKFICTELEIKSMKFTGFFKNDNCVGKKKYDLINQHLKDKKKLWEDVVFFSDHHSDLPVFIASKKIYAVRPTKKLLELLKIRKICFTIIK